MAQDVKHFHSNVTLRIPVVINPPLVNSQYQDCLARRKSCQDPGILIEFYKLMSQFLHLKFVMVPAHGYGQGSRSENGTVFQLLRDGQADFMGPLLYFTPERNLVATKSNAFERQHIYFYGIPRYMATGYDVPEMLGSVVFALLLCTMIAMFLLRDSHIQNFVRIENLRFFSFFNGILTALSLATIGIILNLYVSMLSVKLTEQNFRGPNFKTIDNLRRLVAGGKTHLFLSSKTGGSSKAVLQSLRNGQAPEMIRKLEKNVFFKITYSDTLKKVRCQQNRLAALTRRTFEMTEAWLANCEALGRTSGRQYFGDNMVGFYFTRRNGEIIKWFERLVNHNMNVLQSMFRLVKNRRMRRHQHSLKCANNNWKASPKYTISLAAMWNITFKGVLSYGLLIALMLLAAEKAHYELRGRHRQRLVIN